MEYGQFKRPLTQRSRVCELRNDDIRSLYRESDTVGELRAIDFNDRLREVAIHERQSVSGAGRIAKS